MKTDFETNNIHGYLKIQSFNDENILVSTYEDQNLIMNTARNSMAYMQGNVLGQNHPINSFRIGNKGYLSDPSMPKVPGLQQNEYNPDMTGLFQQTTGVVFECDFTVSGAASQTLTSHSEKMYNNGALITYTGESCTMTRTVSDRVVTFEITIPQGAQNAPTSLGMPSIDYSEAQLYCGDRIFSMKTFPQKYKDENLKLVVTWSIIF